jgi:hypothetical protein
MERSAKSVTRERPGRDARALLYHYTTAHGLEGILRRRTAWATAARYLNDAQEVRYAVQLAQTRLAELADEAPTARRDLIARLSRHLDRLDSDRPLVCVFSLTRRADDLSQWRAYCPQSGGFSLGFAPPALREVAENQGCVLEQCVYDADAHRRMIDKAINAVVSKLPARSSRGRSAADPLGHALVRRIERIAPLIKWPDYEAEEEWRIIWAATPTTINRLRYRATASLFIPYVEIDLSANGALPLEAIHVGPGPHQNNAIVSLAYLLRSLGVHVRSLQRSRIPLRAF